MCGIAGILNLKKDPIPNVSKKLEVMNDLIAHRGPDGKGVWSNDKENVGFAHRRLSIIDLSKDGAQPMKGENNSYITFNGEIYNYKELREKFSHKWSFTSQTDTECILAAYAQYGPSCIDHFNGMFSFAVWDENEQSLFCARDRFGIKPFYYLIEDDVFYFASEPKALMPFVKKIETDQSALSEYVIFQHTIGDQTLFRGIKKLLPGHALHIKNGDIKTWAYWDVEYKMSDQDSQAYYEENLKDLMEESMNLHLRSDVPLGSYLSGGIDSALISAMAAEANPENNKTFHGKFTDHPGYDESNYAQSVADKHHLDLHQIDITSEDFENHIHDVIYMLDTPVAGPGAFPQYMTSQLASQHVKVVLGGQGGDEIFGGYARYLIGYLEQCLKAAIDGTYKNGNFLVTIESIVPNLGLLREYKPLLRKFWQQGLFEEMDHRYFRLIDRSSDMNGEIAMDQLDTEKTKEDFLTVFNDRRTIKKEAYFDSMTRFDFKCLLPALLHIEDRMSMAHGIESRVPFLHHPLIEFMATVPPSFKFPGGQMKYLLKETFKSYLPNDLMNRRDKMGFPVPLKEWFDGPLNEFIVDIFSSQKTKQRDFTNTEAILENFGSGGRFSRKMWGLLSLEIWQQQFHDRQSEYQKMIT